MAVSVAPVRGARKALLLVSLAAACAVLGGRAAAACGCWNHEPERLIRRTPTIFAGRVVEVRRTPVPTPGANRLTAPPEPGGEAVTAIVEVTERTKGDVPDRVEVRAWGVVERCGWNAFPLGSRIAVFGAPLDSAGVVRAGACGTVSPGMSFGQQRTAFSVSLTRYRTGRERTDAAIAAAPGAGGPWFEKGRFLEDWEERAPAAHAYSEAARLAPELAAAYASGGRVNFALERFEAAKASLLRATELDPADAASARLLNVVRLRTGDLEALTTSDFRRLSMRDLDLSDRALPDRDFSGATLEGFRIAGADLRRARFAGARMGASAEGADLRGADFKDATVGGRFRGAKLDGAVLDGTRFRGASLEGASLRGVSARGASFQGTPFTGAAFDGADFSGAVFNYHGSSPDGSRGTRDTDFADARLVEADLRLADLRGSDLSRADLRGARFDGARFDCRTRFPEGFEPNRAGMVSADVGCTGAQRFVRQNLSEFHAPGLDLRGASFRGTSIRGGWFRGADLAGADFTWTSGWGRFDGANLAGARFDHARVVYSFDGARLDGASFRGASVRLSGFFGAERPDRPRREFGAQDVAFLRHAIVECEDNPKPSFDLGSVGVFVERGCNWRRYTPFDARGADLRNFDLSRTDLRAFDFTGADLRGANLAEADLSGAKLDGASLLGARYNPRRWTRTRWPAGFDIAKEAVARGMVPTDVVTADRPARVRSPENLSMAADKEDMQGAVVPDLSGRDLDGLDLHGAWLRRGRLAGASLRGARLTWANLYGADLSGADLRGADLRDAILEDVVLEGALHDDGTTWPAGFRRPALPRPDTGASDEAAPAPARAGARASVHDCAKGEGYAATSYARPAGEGGELILLGVYQATGGPGRSAGTAEAKVAVRRTAPHVLVLSSYERVHWTVEASPDARIERIILNGHHPQTIAAPPGVEVVERFGQAALGHGYHWPGYQGDPTTRRMVDRLRESTSREVSAFAGCYYGSLFTVEDGPP